MGKSAWKNIYKKIEKTCDIKINCRHGSFCRRSFRRNIFQKILSDEEKRREYNRIE
jgi:hypothetical protein